jgi:hypothetical protein
VVGSPTSWGAACAIAVVLALAGIRAVHAQADADGDKLSIERLMQDGWQIDGYTGALDGWSSFILFRHPSHSHLVQCRAGYDVLRQKRVTINCYELR